MAITVLVASTMSDMSKKAKAKILNINEAVREDAEDADDNCAILFFFLFLALA